MQNLRENLVNQAGVITVMDQNQHPVEMIMYENALGKVALGTIEPQAKLQTRRVGFRK